MNRHGSARLLLLGAGSVGAAAAGLAGKLSALTAITVADRSQSAAASAAAAAGPRASAVQLDVIDRAGLLVLMRRHDVVLNCVGPYFRFARPVFDAAFEAGIDYLDVDDDWQPTLELLGADAAWREAGRTAILGIGANPGLANLAAVAAGRAVGKPERMVTGWTMPDQVGREGSAEGEHWLFQSSGRIRLFAGGKLSEASPLAECMLDYPGIGRRAGLTVGHPEPITLPRAFPSLKECVNVMVLPGSLAAALRYYAGLVDQGRLDPSGAAEKMAQEYAPGSYATDLPDGPGYPGIFAIAESGDGKNRRHAAARPKLPATAGGMVAAAPLVAGLVLLLSGNVAGPGVLTPETAFDPEPFFATLGLVTGAEGPMLELVGG